jgi:hypothetical protein
MSTTAAVAAGTRPSSIPQPAATTTRRRVRWVGLLLYVSGLIAFLLISTLIFGWVEGYEFSAQTFGRRSFTYCQIPLIGVQITPPDYRVEQVLPIVQRQKSSSLFPPPTGAIRWDAVQIDDAESHTVRGDADFLYRYLAHAEIDWLDWTDRHPQLARPFWIAVVTMARDGLYLEAADLCEWALERSGDADTAQATERLVAHSKSLYEKAIRDRFAGADSPQMYRLRSRLDQLDGDGWKDP